MAKQTTHKLLAIALVMVAFSAPFYLEKQINSLSDNSFLLGALARTDASDSESDEAQMDETDWVDVVGTSFIGENLQ